MQPEDDSMIAVLNRSFLNFMMRKTYGTLQCMLIYSKELFLLQNS